MRKNNPKDFLGRGLKFPIQVDHTSGCIKESEYDESVKESIHMILMTRPGERLMHPEFGCGIHRYAFSTIDYTTLQMMQREVLQALMLWEPRITDVEVEVEQNERNPSIAMVGIRYLVRTTNNPYNMVYPYYLFEGDI